MGTFFAWLAKHILPFILDYIKDEIRQSVKDAVEEKEAKKRDQEHVDKSVEDVRKPVDPAKTVAERQKDEEEKFDRFRERLNP